MYECTICQSVNHASRVRCAVCGAVPANYSILGVTSVSPQGYPIPIGVAAGLQRLRRQQKLSLRTVGLDYYADGSAD